MKQLCKLSFYFFFSWSSKYFWKKIKLILKAFKKKTIIVRSLFHVCKNFPIPRIQKKINSLWRKDFSQFHSVWTSNLHHKLSLRLAEVNSVQNPTWFAIDHRCSDRSNLTARSGLGIARSVVWSEAALEFSVDSWNLAIQAMSLKRLAYHGHQMILFVEGKKNLKLITIKNH